MLSAEVQKKIHEKICEHVDTFVKELGAEPDIAIVTHAHWIVGETVDGEIYATICSKCEFDGYVGYNYCPNCGAKMDAEGQK